MPDVKDLKRSRRPVPWSVSIAKSPTTPSYPSAPSCPATPPVPCTARSGARPVHVAALRAATPTTQLPNRTPQPSECSLRTRLGRPVADNAGSVTALAHAYVPPAGYDREEEGGRVSLADFLLGARPTTNQEQRWLQTAVHPCERHITTTNSPRPPIRPWGHRRHVGTSAPLRR